MSADRTPTSSLMLLSTSQRRRAEALLLVQVLFPTCTPEQASRLAKWIARGERP